MLGPNRSGSWRPTPLGGFGFFFFFFGVGVGGGGGAGVGWDESGSVCRPNAAAAAMFTAMVDFPTPPFAEEMRRVLDTCWMPRFCGRPRCIRGRVGGGAPDRGRPWGHFYYWLA